MKYQVFGELFLPKINVGVIVAITLLPIGSQVFAQSTELSREVTVSDMTSDNTPDFIKQQQIEEIESWRKEAVELLSKEASKVSPSEDFVVLKTGFSKNINGRRLGEEYVQSLPPERLEAAFEYGKTTWDNPKARLEIAKSVLNEPSLSRRHSEATYEKVAMSFILTEDRESVVAEFAISKSAIIKDDEFGLKLIAAERALTEPRSAEDFEASIDLMTMSSKMGVRLQMNWITTPMLVKYRSEGIAGFAPEKFNGSGVAIEALAQGAFDKNEFRILSDIQENLKNYKIADNASLTRTKYWIAMGYFGTGRFEEARPVFNEILELRSGDLFEAWAMIRLGEIYQETDNKLEAAIKYLEVKNNYPQHVPAVELAEELFEFLSIHNMIESDEAIAAYETRNSKSGIAMNLGGVQ